MAHPAQVKSIDSLQVMTAALQTFHADTSAALDELDMEIRRAVQWIGEDCRQYWKSEHRRSTERVVEAKLALEHAQIFRGGERQSSCIEEKKTLDREKRRLQLAETKIEAIRHWASVLEREVNEYRAIRHQFANWLESDSPKAVALMGRTIAALETYVRIGIPDSHVPIAPATDSTQETAEKKEEKS